MNDHTHWMYRVWFLGEARYYRTLLPALEYRKALLASGVRDDNVHVEQRDAIGWTFYDVDQFLDGLARLLAPAD